MASRSLDLVSELDRFLTALAALPEASKGSSKVNDKVQEEAITVMRMLQSPIILRNKNLSAIREIDKSIQKIAEKVSTIAQKGGFNRKWPFISDTKKFSEEACKSLNAFKADIAEKLRKAESPEQLVRSLNIEIHEARHLFQEMQTEKILAYLGQVDPAAELTLRTILSPDRYKNKKLTEILKMQETAEEVSARIAARAQSGVLATNALQKTACKAFNDFVENTAELILKVSYGPAESSARNLNLSAENEQSLFSEIQEAKILAHLGDVSNTSDALFYERSYLEQWGSMLAQGLATLPSN